MCFTSGTGARRHPTMRRPGSSRSAQPKSCLRLAAAEPHAESLALVLRKPCLLPQQSAMYANAHIFSQALPALLLPDPPPRQTHGEHGGHCRRLARRCSLLFQPVSGRRRPQCKAVAAVGLLPATCLSSGRRAHAAAMEAWHRQHALVHCLPLEPGCTTLGSGANSPDWGRAPAAPAAGRQTRTRPSTCPLAPPAAVSDVASTGCSTTPAAFAVAPRCRFSRDTRARPRKARHLRSDSHSKRRSLCTPALILLEALKSPTSHRR